MSAPDVIGSVRVLPRRRVRVSDLKPHPRNPRATLEPGDPDFENIRASLRQIGLADEIVWNEATGRIVGGHQRLAVLRAEGARDEDEIDVKVVNIPDERREMAAVILLNKAEGRWDGNVLVRAVDDLRLLDLSDASIGWKAEDLEVYRVPQDYPAVEPKEAEAATVRCPRCGEEFEP